MHQISIKVSKQTHSGLKKLSMVNGDGRLGAYLVWALEEHIKANQDSISEFDRIVKRDEPMRVAPAPIKEDNRSFDEIINGSGPQ